MWVPQEDNFSWPLIYLTVNHIIFFVVQLMVDPDIDAVCFLNSVPQQSAFLEHLDLSYWVESNLKDSTIFVLTRHVPISVSSLDRRNSMNGIDGSLGIAAVVPRETGISNISQILWTLTPFAQNSMTLGGDSQSSRTVVTNCPHFSSEPVVTSLPASLSRALPTHGFSMFLCCGKFTVRSVKSVDPSTQSTRNRLHSAPPLETPNYMFLSTTLLKPTPSGKESLCTSPQFRMPSHALSSASDQYNPLNWISRWSTTQVSVLDLCGLPHRVQARTSGWIEYVSFVLSKSRREYKIDSP